MAYEREPLVGSRRQFLKYGAGSALGIGLTATGIPLFRGFSGALDAAPATTPNLVTMTNSVPPDPTARTLVVLQLGGGNDGLNTVIPYKDPLYAQLRPTIGQNAAAVLPISDTLALHPHLGGLHGIWDLGNLAVVEGVEYPTPNFSHFRGTEIWMTADDQNVGSLGWLGHALDHLSNHPALVAASLGVTTPRALVGMQPTNIALGGSLSGFAYRPVGRVDPGAVSAVFDYMDSVTPTANRYKKLVTASHTIAQDAMAGVAKAASGYTPAVHYPNSQLAAGLQTIAQLIHGGVGARVLYLATGGFDTHSNERGTHDGLMQTLGDGLSAFWQDITAHGHGDSVAVMSFSEFGRRPAENASHGTDHGSSAPLFVIGGAIKGGVYGTAPSLASLDNGNLKVQHDFRTVYAALLQNWLGFTQSDILPYGPYQPLPLFGPSAVPPARPIPDQPTPTVPTGGTGPSPLPPSRSPPVSGPTGTQGTAVPLPVSR
ncbi:MAG: DUF1501 domain-containing protein [Thermomicrobiales bacterium]